VHIVSQNFGSIFQVPVLSVNLFFSNLLLCDVGNYLDGLIDFTILVFNWVEVSIEPDDCTLFSQELKLPLTGYTSS